MLQEQFQAEAVHAAAKSALADFASTFPDFTFGCSLAITVEAQKHGLVFEYNFAEKGGHVAGGSL